MDNYMLWVWLGILLITAIVEIATTELVSIWFCIGALFALPFSFITPIWAQILIFVGVSAIALAIARPLLKKMKIGKISTNSDDYVGKEVILLKDVSKFDAGEAKLNDVVFNAVLEDGVDTTITKGTVVVIAGIKGNKLIIKEKEVLS